jgi:hypothetical protein
MSKEGRSLSEYVVNFSNTIDIGMFAFGALTGNVGLIILSVASYGAGNWMEDKLEERRKSGKFVI